jgi:hypothetical protein
MGMDLGQVPPSEEKPEPFRVRLMAVLWATCTFAVLSYVVLGHPPPFLVTVAFGSLVTLGVEWHARALERDAPQSDRAALESVQRDPADWDRPGTR